ncbi:hypothetical protein BKA80DRAFT_262134 [Phyllosticta citrichinensis]
MHIMHNADISQVKNDGQKGQLVANTGVVKANICVYETKSKSTGQKRGTRSSYEARWSPCGCTGSKLSLLDERDYYTHWSKHSSCFAANQGGRATGMQNQVGHGLSDCAGHQRLSKGMLGQPVYDEMRPIPGPSILLRRTRTSLEATCSCRSPGRILSQKCCWRTLPRQCWWCCLRLRQVCGNRPVGFWGWQCFQAQFGSARVWGVGQEGEPRSSVCRSAK